MNKRAQSATFFFVFAICLAVDSCSPTQPADIIVDEAVFARVTQNNFSREEKLKVRKALAPLVSPKCTEAFVRAKLRSPLQVLTEEGVVLYPSTDLYHDSAKRLGLIYEEVRLNYWEQFSSCRAQAGTVPAERYGLRLTTDGRARIFLHETAFQGESFLFGRLSLTGVLAHEFIHVGGQPSTPGWFFQHDLAGFEHYDAIMSACQ